MTEVNPLCLLTDIILDGAKFKFQIHDQMYIARVRRDLMLVYNGQTMLIPGPPADPIFVGITSNALWYVTTNFIHRFGLSSKRVILQFSVRAAGLAGDHLLVLTKNKTIKLYNQDISEVCEAQLMTDKMVSFNGQTFVSIKGQVHVVRIESNRIIFDAESELPQQTFNCPGYFDMLVIHPIIGPLISEINARRQIITSQHSNSTLPTFNMHFISRKDNMMVAVTTKNDSLIFWCSVLIELTAEKCKPSLLWQFPDGLILLGEKIRFIKKPQNYNFFVLNDRLYFLNNKTSVIDPNAQQEVYKFDKLMTPTHSGDKSYFIVHDETQNLHYYGILHSFDSFEILHYLDEPENIINLGQSYSIVEMSQQHYVINFELNQLSLLTNQFVSQLQILSVEQILHKVANAQQLQEVSKFHSFDAIDDFNQNLIKTAKNHPVFLYDQIVDKMKQNHFTKRCIKYLRLQQLNECQNKTIFYSLEKK